MAKAISINVAEIPSSDRIRVQNALFTLYGPTWGIADPSEVTASHIVNLLEQYIKNRVRKAEQQTTESNFDSNFSSPTLET